MLSEMFPCIAGFNFDCSNISDDVNLYQIYHVDIYFMIISLAVLLWHWSIWQKLDPTQFVRIYGRQAKIHIDPSVAMAAEGPQIM